MPVVHLVETKPTGDTNYIYKNDLDKACFQHNIAFAKYEDLTKKQNQIKS